MFRYLGIICILVFTIGCSDAVKKFHAAKLATQPLKTAPPINDYYSIPINADRVALTKAYFMAHNKALAQSLPAGDTIDAIRFVPRIVVVHFTAITTLGETLTYFAPSHIASDRGLVTQGGALNVGIQFVVDRDGTIYSNYPDNVMARHVIGLNHVAIGIENVANADLNKRETREKRPMTQAQLHANVALIRYLAGKYPTIKFVIGHYEYRDLEHPAHPAHHLFAEDQPKYRTDKIDPGVGFMKALRKELKNPP